MTQTGAKPKMRNAALDDISALKPIKLFINKITVIISHLIEGIYFFVMFPSLQIHELTIIPVGTKL
jgi:hypothetical protein